MTNTLGLLVFCLVVAGTFTAAAMSTGIETRPAPDDTPATARAARAVRPLAGADHRRLHGRALPELLRRAGADDLIQLSDPMVRGDNYLLTGNWSVNYWLSFHPTLLAVPQGAGRLVGHVVGVVVAHDRAIALLPQRHHVTGQLGMLAVMVATRSRASTC